MSQASSIVQICLDSSTPVATPADIEAMIDALPRVALASYFASVSCSQCGRSFGPGWHGFSACRSHRGVFAVGEAA
jgi:hypothetical protein